MPTNPTTVTLKLVEWSIGKRVHTGYVEIHQDHAANFYDKNGHPTATPAAYLSGLLLGSYPIDSPQRDALITKHLARPRHLPYVGIEDDSLPDPIAGSPGVLR